MKNIGIDMEKKVSNARIIGAVYFVSLGLIKFTATMFNGKFLWLDLIILLLAIISALLKNKTVYFVLGILGALISLYLGSACLLLNLESDTSTSQLAFFMGYLLAVSSFIASSCFVYMGIYYIRPLKLRNT